MEEKSGGISGGIYHKLQIELTYNSNHIEGSRLSKDPGGQAVLLAGQSQQKVLAAHIAVPQPGGILLGQPDGPQGGGCKAAVRHFDRLANLKIRLYSQGSVHLSFGRRLVGRRENLF